MWFRSVLGVIGSYLGWDSVGGMSSLCHDDLVMGVVSEWGLFFDILVMIFRGGVRGVGDDVHRDQGTVLTLMRGWSCRGLWVDGSGWVIRWVVVDCVC